MTEQLTLIEEWHARLADMKLKLEQPSQLAWYYEVQARILKYLISRYSHSEIKNIAFRPSTDEPTDLALPYLKSRTGVSRPIKNRDQISLILHRISATSSAHPGRSSEGWSFLE